MPILPVGALAASKVFHYAGPQKRRFAKLTLAGLVVLLLLAGVAVYVYGKPMFREMVFRYKWRRAEQFAVSPDIVLFEEEPAKARELIKRSNYHVPATVHFGKEWNLRHPAWWGPPACYTPQSLNDILPSQFQKYGVVFIHSRESPSGVKRLVIVNCASWDYSPTGHTFAITAHAYSAGTAQHPLSLNLTSGFPMSCETHSMSDYFRIFAGQPDPVDPTHFTIRYQLNDQGGTIDGWLREPITYKTGSIPQPITLQIRDGPVKLLEE